MLLSQRGPVIYSNMAEAGGVRETRQARKEAFILTCVRKGGQEWNLSNDKLDKRSKLWSSLAQWGHERS